MMNYDIYYLDTSRDNLEFAGLFLYIVFISQSRQPLVEIQLIIIVHVIKSLIAAVFVGSGDHHWWDLWQGSGSSECHIYLIQKLKRHVYYLV